MNLSVSALSEENPVIEGAIMPSPSNRDPRDLIQELEQDATQFSFFQAVRLLALTARQYGGRRQSHLPSDLRFRTAATFSFPASELTRYQSALSEAPDAEQTRDEMTVNFLGLVGPSATLPQPYTELVIKRRQSFRDTGLHGFLDIFSHRAIALFYSAWRKYRYWLDVEDGEPDRLTRNLLDLSGVGVQSLREKLGSGNTDQLAETFFAFYCGLLSQKPISTQAMRTVIQGFFGVPVEIEQYVGRWIELPPDEHSRLGGKACELGVSTFSGRRVWDRQTKIQVRMGPMRRTKFEGLLPGRPGAKALETLVQYMVGHGLACDVKLILDRRDVPEPCLKKGQRLLLGGNTWLFTRPIDRDPEEKRYRLLQ
ncbi:MAG: type VI secretion system baseplate subunit TssG [Betaproteobacteria bacterium]|nr:type VI secretion system baseplate subunit TssG [Betaproteobacteria bacterium]